MTKNEHTSDGDPGILVFGLALGSLGGLVSGSLAYALRCQDAIAAGVECNSNDALIVAIAAGLVSYAATVGLVALIHR